jgi:hypothetical protein
MLFNNITLYSEVIKELALTPGVNIDFGIYDPGDYMNNSTIHYNANDPYWRLGIFTPLRKAPRRERSKYRIDNIARQFIPYTDTTICFVDESGDVQVDATPTEERVLELPDTIVNHTQEIINSPFVEVRNVRSDEKGIVEGQFMLSQIINNISKNTLRFTTVLLWFCRHGESAFTHIYPQRSIIAEYNKLFLVRSTLEPLVQGNIFSVQYEYGCSALSKTRIRPRINIYPFIVLLGFDIADDIQINYEKCDDNELVLSINNMIWQLVNANYREHSVFIAVIPIIGPTKMSVYQQIQIFKNCGFEKYNPSEQVIQDLSLPENYRYMKYEYEFCKKKSIKHPDLF